MSSLTYFLITMIPGTIFLGISDIITKRVLTKGVSERLLLGVVWLSSGLVFFIITLFVGIPKITADFLPSVFITIALNVVGQWSWYRAFRYGEVSVIAPMRLLTPVLVVATGFFFLGERPSILGAIGILITIIGFYVLTQSRGKGKVRSLSFFRVPGVSYALFAVILFSLSFPFDKRAVVASSALLTATCIYIMVGGINLLISLYQREGSEGKLKSLLKTKEYVFLVIVNTLGALLVLHALNFTLVAYASSVKRLQALWSIILSGVFLNEAIVMKIIAAVIMLIGVAITLIVG